MACQNGLEHVGRDEPTDTASWTKPMAPSLELAHMDEDQKLEKVTLDMGQIEQLRAHFGLDAFPDARFSTYFTLQLMQIEANRLLSTHSIVREIRTLESGGAAAYTKAASPFTGDFLHGLWHKHFTDARFLLRNIRNEWDHKGMLLKGLEEIAREHSGQTIGTEITGKIVHMAVLTSQENRGNEDRMTGEWIVFVPHDGHNHYLAISTHQTPGMAPPEHDRALRTEILGNCGWEFPFLFDILGAEPQSEQRR